MVLKRHGRKPSKRRYRSSSSSESSGEERRKKSPKKTASPTPPTLGATFNLLRLRSTQSYPPQLRKMYAGKRAADEVCRAATKMKGANANDTESRWWLQVSIGNFRLRAFYDTGTSRMVMGVVGLQMTTALGRPGMPSYGRRAKVIGVHTAHIAGYVELHFQVAGARRDIRVAVIPDDKVDC